MDEEKPLCNLEGRVKHKNPDITKYEFACPNLDCFYMRIVDGVKGNFCAYEEIILSLTHKS